MCLLVRYLLKVRFSGESYGVYILVEEVAFSNKLTVIMSSVKRRSSDVRQCVESGTVLALTLSCKSFISCEESKLVVSTSWRLRR